MCMSVTEQITHKTDKQAFIVSLQEASIARELAH